MHIIRQTNEVDFGSFWFYGFIC